MSQTVIKVENLYKEYKLGIINHGYLMRDLQSWWARVRGKEDPNSLISEHHGEGATKGSFLALKDVSLEIKKGDRVGIIGKNGAGKSTLLKIISKVTSPTKGEVKIKGRVGSLLEVGTGFHGELTGRENIFLNGLILGMTKHEVARKLDEIVDFAKIDKYIDTPVKRYSSGMFVRLGFAVAAHLDPEILVVDEVLAVGDAEFQKKAIGKMQDVSESEGRTVLFVSHNMGNVKQLCNKGVILEKGFVGFAGDVKEAIAEYFKVNTEIISTKIENRKDREGNGKFQFTDIKLLDNSNNEISEIFTGETLKIKLFYKKNKEIEIDKMVFDISIQDFYQNYILQFISDEIGSKFQKNEENSITLIIPELLLRGGKYYIKLFATYKTTELKNHCDNIENAATLVVISSDFWNSGKIIRSNNTAVNKGYFLV